MTNTTYYNLNIVEGTDIVNPLTVDNPNYEKIDETMHNNALAGVTLASEIANGTVHAITRENSECAVIRFIATSNWKAGDTATVDGVPVTALLPSGETLPNGAYVINSNVLCILTGTNLTIYAERKKVDNANEIAYNDTNVGLELTRLDGEIDNINSNLPLHQLVPKTMPFIANANGILVIIIEPQTAQDSYYYVKDSMGNDVARGRSKNGDVYTLTFPVIKNITYSDRTSENANIGYCNFYQFG